MVIISTKDKPIILVVLAALFYTIAIFLVGVSFYNIQFSLDEFVIKERIYLLELIAIFTIGGISFSQRRTIFFDLEKKKLKDQLSVGPFKIGKWQTLPDIKYISVFNQPLKEGNYIFEVNLWYEKNKHFNLYRNSHYESALEMGFHIANKLNVKLLDATIPNNFKYLDMDELKEKYKE